MVVPELTPWNSRCRSFRAQLFIESASYGLAPGLYIQRTYSPKCKLVFDFRLLTGGKKILNHVTIHPIMTDQKPKARIIGIGSYLPEKVLTNQDFEKMVDTTDEWIQSRTGMKERRIAAPGESTSDMGLQAAKKALEAAQLAPEDIDLILVTTTTPDYVMPSTACVLQAKLGLPKIPAFDLQAACTGYLYGLSTAKSFIESGMYRNVLLVAAEKMSAFVDYQDRSTCVLFGDAASAAVISNKGAGLSIDTVCLGADGALSELIIVPAGGSSKPASHETIENRDHYFKMQGREVFKHAVRRMEQSVVDCLEKAGISENEISWLVPHQANQRILDALSNRLSIPEDRVCITIHKYGNTSAPSLAVTLDEHLQTNQPETGEHLLLVAFGAGLTWGASVLTQVEDSNE